MQEGIKQNDGKHRHHSSGGTHGNRRDGCGSGVAAGGGTAALLHDRGKKLQERKEANDKKIQELKEAAAASGKAAKPGSLADKVGMVSRYNEVNDKRK